MNKMILKVFSLYDSKVKAFQNPFLDFSEGSAVRGLEEALTDPKSKISKYASDYTLYELGEYDNSTGMFRQKEQHTNILNVSALQKAQNVVNLEQNL